MTEGDKVIYKHETENNVLHYRQKCRCVKLTSKP